MPKGGFKCLTARELDDIEERDKVPEAVKLKILAKFLKVKRKQRAKDYEEHLQSVDNWKRNSRHEAKMEMAKSVLEGREVVLEEVGTSRSCGAPSS